MKIKKEIKEIRPGKALASLNDYHENVVILANAVNISLEHVDARIRPVLESAVKNVLAFYETEN